MTGSPAKTALVTGANRGIGAAIATGLATRGIRVLLGVREEASAEIVARAITRGGGLCAVTAVDTGDPVAIDDCLSRLEEAGERVDILVNNAGILEGERLLDMEEADVLRSIRVNALGPLRLIRALAPAMAERGGGRVVNLSSDWGSLSNLGPGAYGISKALLNAITVKTAGELPPTVKVNAMDPGWVRSSMGGASGPRSPEEGADTAVFLATLPDDGPSGGLFRDRRAVGWMD
ncbi:MAG: SDR family NAD(P)-dependent oxidoreductase [Flavobacteriaceae bacterium]